MLFELASNSAATVEHRSTVRPVLCKATQELREAFGTIKHGYEYPHTTGANWSTHDLIAYCVDQIGACDMTAATWSCATHAADKLITMQTSGQLTSIYMLVDWRVQVRTPGVLELAKCHFNDIRVSSCHAKAFVLMNKNWSISYVGSANFTNNPRIECGHLSTNRHTAEFHRNWIRSEIALAKPFGMDMRKAKPDGRA